MKKIFLLFILMFSASLSWAKNTFVIEFARPLSAAEQKQWGAQAFSPSSRSEYFKRVYSVETTLSREQLEKSKLVKSVEGINTIETYGVIPVGERSTLTNDQLLAYQWYLANKGQIVTQDKDDITSIQVPGLKGFDIQGQQTLGLKLSRDAVVAVIDYGVDVNHPDLKDRIFQNTPECNNGEVPLNPKTDNDGNGYNGDCKGWNFTGINAGMNKVVDDSGHGTHVAGLIAADSNNDIGISGVHSQMKILPLQVLRKAQSSKDFSSRSDWLAKAILYAAKMKVDVINMSLGWPLFLDKKYLQEAVKEALAQGVIIVAAAGNNNHSAPIMPCAYEGVICVGSVSNNGAVSAFSNFGGHVDILAPGDQILSLLPMSLDPDYFSITGYEIKSGTSQAAPLVAAAAAVLKVSQPQLNSRQVLARLLQSSKAVSSSEKYFSGGTLQVDRAMQTTQTQIVRPIFKGSNLVPYDYVQRRFTYDLKIENLSDQSQKATVQVASNNTDVQLRLATAQISLAPWQVLTIPVTGHLSQLENSSFLPFSVTVQTSAQKQTYKAEIQLARDLINDQNVQRISLPLKKGQDLKTIPARWLKQADLQYYTLTTTEEAVSLDVYSLEKTQMKSLGQINLPGVKQVITFAQTDVNLDGEVDYEVQAVLVKNEQKIVRLYHFDKNLLPLWGQLSEWEFPVESTLLPGQNVQSMPILHPTLGRIAVPVFLGVGTMPLMDQDLKPLEPKNTKSQMHAYYLLPEMKDGKVSLSTRVLDSKKNLNVWRKALKMRFQENFSLLYLLEGQQLLINVGEGFDRQTWKVNFSFSQDLSFTYQAIQSSKVLNGFTLDLATDLNDIENKNYLFLGQYSSQRWDLLKLEANRAQDILSISPKEESETLQIYLKSFTKGSDVYSFVQTPSEILLSHSGSRGLEQWRYPFHVSSFISQEVYSDQAIPVIARVKGERSPGLLVDSSQILDRHVYVITLDEQGLLTPLKTSLQIPENCLTMNPVSETATRTAQFVFYCQVSEENSELWLLPLQ